MPLDSKTIRSFILNEFHQKRKIDEGFQNLCKILGDDVIGFDEFQFWFNRFSVGKMELEIQIKSEIPAEMDKNKIENDGEEEEDMSLGVCATQPSSDVDSESEEGEDESLQKCKKCGIFVAETNGKSINLALKEHSIEFHCERKRYKCKECDYSDWKMNRVREHSATLHGKYYRPVDQIDQQMRDEWNGVMAECFPGVFPEDGEEKDEINSPESSEKSDSYQCKLCDVTLKSTGKNRWNLKMHVIGLHCVSKQYKCNFCEFTNSRKSTIRLHSTRKHGKYEPPVDLVDDKMREEWNDMFGKCFPEIARTTQFQL